MRRFFPHPALSIAIFLLWMALNNASSLAHAVLAMILAIGLPLLTRRFWPEHPPTVKLLPAIRLFGIVIYDILLASIDVAKLVLGPTKRIKPAFIEVPLDMQDPFVGTLLASIVSLTPGTVSIDIDRTRWVLQVHALNVDDREATIRAIKARYEQPLKEIFSC
ncbi:MAG: Na+/H+ antiporter subunit E [Betaproteobacteria bacterium HGW-Betaproteobacteria-1]|jgi:multicomponent K+:H+ antiporter subunit E|nr:MAG: Na+/H+ antiporter subunit E [Betaproteobacteria bacterium HGW-Betaproteobacteria-1]